MGHTHLYLYPNRTIVLHENNYIYGAITAAKHFSPVRPPLSPPGQGKLQAVGGGVGGAESHGYRGKRARLNCGWLVR